MEQGWVGMGSVKESDRTRGSQKQNQTKLKQEHNGVGNKNKSTNTNTQRATGALMEPEMVSGPRS